MKIPPTPFQTSRPPYRFLGGPWCLAEVMGNLLSVAAAPEGPLLKGLPGHMDQGMLRSNRFMKVWHYCAVC